MTQSPPIPIPVSATNDFRGFLDQFSREADVTPECLLASDLPLTIRYNSLKATPEFTEAWLRAEGFVLRPLELPISAAEVQEEPFPISKSIPHILGWIYIQSLSSMTPPIVLQPLPSQFILDMAAAPGSKSTELAALTQNQSAILANDISQDRLRSLIHNLDRGGMYSLGASCERGDRLGRLYPEQFDRVLLDAPCSALGILAKSPEVMSWWTRRESESFAARQQQLLISGIKALRPGGLMTYSTCTLTPTENEEALNWILEQYPVEVLDIRLGNLNARNGLTKFGDALFSEELKKAVRFYPGETNTEGFFLCLLRKTDTTGSIVEERVSGDVPVLVDSGDKSIRPAVSYLSNEFGIPPSMWSSYRYFSLRDEIWMTSSAWEGKPRGTLTRLGIKLAREQRGGRWRFTTNAAQILAESLTNRIIELQSPTEAADFLAARIVRLPTDFDGAAVIRWNGATLGVGVIHGGQLKSQVPVGRRGQ